MDSFKDALAWAKRENLLNPPDPEVDQRSIEGPRVVRLGDVNPEPVHWLWSGYVARGKVNLVAGDPGLGKSWATLDLAARVTVGGETPDHQHIMEQGSVVLVTAEDGLADTVRPRVDVQGGDAQRVHVLEGIIDGEGNDRLPSLMQDIHHLEQVVMSNKAHLLIVDPLNAHTGRADSHNDAQIRRALTPLAKMAERTGAAVLVVMHLNQATLQPALYRVQGSIGYVGAARSVLLVARDKTNPAFRVIVPIKSNLSAPMPAVAFTITEEPALAWQGIVEVNIADLLAAPSRDHDEVAPAESSAEDFLRRILASGPMDAKDVFKGAGAAGIATRTLQRAKADLGVQVNPTHQKGKKGVASWVWKLPFNIGRQPLHMDDGDLNNADVEVI